MRAIVVSELGGPERMVVGGRPDPVPDAARAQEDLAGRRTTGKLILLPELVTDMKCG